MAKPNHIPLENEDGFKKEEVDRIFRQQGGTQEMADQFYNKHSSTGWVLNGTRIKNIAPLIANCIKNWQSNGSKGKTEPTKTPLKLK